MGTTRAVENDGTVVLRLAGDVDAWTASEAHDQALGLLHTHPVVIDLSEVIRLERQAVAELVALSRALLAAGRPRLELRNVGPGVLHRLGALRCAFRVVPRTI